jgi:hypothetical protein
MQGGDCVRAGTLSRNAAALFAALLVFAGTGCALVDALRGEAAETDAGAGAVDGDIDANFANVAFFEHHGDFPAGAGPSAVVVLERASAPALVAVANPTANRVSILHPSPVAPGDLIFGDPLEVQVTPIRLVAADFNGDGLDDLVVVGSDPTDEFEGEVQVWFQTGGTPAFSGPVSIPVSGSANRVAVGDLDDDGNLDVAVFSTNEAEEQLSQIIRGTSPTTFAEAESLAVSVWGEYALVVADLDGDGLDDIAAGDAGLAVAYQDSAAAGGFDLVNQPVDHPWAPEVSAHALPGSGPGLVLSGHLTLKVLVRDPLEPRWLFAAETYTPLNGDWRHIALGDLNGDEVIDIVSVEFGGIAIVLRGQGHYFQQVTGLTASGIGLLDVDGDGRKDIVLIHEDTSTISVHLNRI